MTQSIPTSRDAETTRRSTPEPDVIDLTDVGLTVASQSLLLTRQLPKPPAPQPIAWERRLVGAVLATDLAAVLTGCGIAAAVRVRSADGRVHMVAAALEAAALMLAWVLAMWLNRAYEPRFLGVGAEEFRRVLVSASALLATVATVAYARQLHAGRTLVTIALPAATGLALLGRAAVRQALIRARSRGLCLHRVVVVGDVTGVRDLIAMLRSERRSSMEIVGCCVPAVSSNQDDILGVAVLGAVADTAAVIRGSHATTLAVAAGGGLSATGLRSLGWELEGTGVDMVVAPAMMHTAGPRVHLRPVAGLPLIHVEEPQFTGGRKIVKSALDRVIALSALVALAPVFACIAIAVRRSSPGPVFFRQTRVGRDGQPFTMVKFRSMYTDAEARLAALATLNDNHDGLLFKMKRDPRVTPAGRLLRRLSLDELPQLFNVVKGDMSLVGPRPPLPREVALYETDVARRLLVKPGVTGLWQVSGRSDLAWEESVQLDLHYVENWSISLDLSILCRTILAVVGGRGAY